MTSPWASLIDQIYSVSGILDPDSTGTYLPIGLFAGKPSYEREDGAWHLWWAIPVGQWIISMDLGMAEGFLWYREDPDIEGLYLPGGTATGEATVSVV